MHSESPPPVGARVLMALLLVITGCSSSGSEEEQIEAGRQFAQENCQPCHDLTASKTHKIGPYLWQVHGRTAGSVAGYAFSSGLTEQLMASTPITWDDETLDRFLEKPTEVLPRTTMDDEQVLREAVGYSMQFRSIGSLLTDGIADKQQRTDLIAFLRSLKQSTETAKNTPAPEPPPVAATAPPPRRQEPPPAPERPEQTRLGALDIRSIPAAAVLTVDGTDYGPAPKTITDIPPANRTIVATLPGFLPESRTVPVVAGEMTTVTLTLTKKSTLPSYSLTIVTQPSDAEIALLETDTPYRRGLRLPAGSYRFRVSKRGYRSQEGVALISDGDWEGLITLEKEPEPPLQPPVFEKEPEPPVQRLALPTLQDEEIIPVDKPDTSPPPPTRPAPPREKAAQRVQPVTSDAPASNASLSTLTEQQLLQQAQENLTNTAITSPRGDVAFDSYHELLRRQPGHPDAVAGLKQMQRCYLVYVALFNDPEKAEVLRSRLSGMGLPAYRQTMMVNGKQRYRVSLGVFTLRDNAVKAIERVKRTLKLDTLILRRYRRHS
ncbi:MAG: PEGA domain-containing protein [Magnetococcales bacterium]|nr:PEGA domain-containing protein [Magnetococcales bacterium]